MICQFLISRFLFLKLIIILFPKRQTQRGDVKLFWNIVDNEKADLDTRFLERRGAS